MLSPGELVSLVAEALGLPEPTVIVHDRNLVMAGLRTKGGRGRSAAKVTARDAAHLLTAILASGQVKDSVQSVRRYGDTRPQPQRSSNAGFTQLGIKEMSSLPAKHSFVDALEALITAAASGSLAQAGRGNSVEPKGRGPATGAIVEIAALTPGTVGDIRVAGLKSGATASVRYGIPGARGTHDPAHPARRETGAGKKSLRKHHAETDLEQCRRISERTVLRIAQALADLT